MDKSNIEQDCAICLQKYHHPAQLPCGHVFCFLCVKGIAIQSKKCAMCRMQIPSDYFDHPVLIQKTSLDDACAEGDTAKYQWYYEGRNGWWKYDERSNIDLETAYSTEETECLLLLAGTIYCVDFQNMIQFRRSDPRRRRHIKRDLPTLPAKGIAGIKKIDPEPRGLSETITNNVNILEINNTIHDTSATEVLHSEDSNDIVTGVDPPDSIEEIVDNLRQMHVHSEDHITSSNEDETHI